MQILAFIAVSLIITALIIYKINKKFELREFIILIIVVIVPTLGGVYFLENQKEEVPSKFKTKYENEKKIKILKLTFERLNNKNVSSKINFVYDFNYIIKKDDKEYFCNIKSVKVRKIQDDYVFENFEKLKEDCKSK